MNTLMLVALAVVAFCYCGGKYCPKVLSSNKEMLLGVLVGVALCSFAGLRMEGMVNRDGLCTGMQIEIDKAAGQADTPPENLKSMRDTYNLMCSP